MTILYALSLITSILIAPTLCLIWYSYGVTLGSKDLPSTVVRRARYRLLIIGILLTTALLGQNNLLGTYSYYFSAVSLLFYSVFILTPVGGIQLRTDLKTRSKKVEYVLMVSPLLAAYISCIVIAKGGG